MQSRVLLEVSTFACLPSMSQRLYMFFLARLLALSCGFLFLLHEFLIYNIMNHQVKGSSSEKQKEGKVKRIEENLKLELLLRNAFP